MAEVCGAPDNDASLLLQSAGIDSVQVWEFHPDNAPAGLLASNDVVAFCSAAGIAHSDAVSQDAHIGAPVEM